MPTVRNQWNVKPPIGQQIQYGHPLAQNLLGAFLINEQSNTVIDAVTQTTLTLNNSAVGGVKYWGWSLDCSVGTGSNACGASVAAYDRLGKDVIKSSGQAMTILWRGIPQVASNGVCYLAGCTQATAVAAYILGRSNNNWYEEFGSGGGGGVNFTNFAPLVAFDGTERQAVFVCGDGSQQFYEGNGYAASTGAQLFGNYVLSGTAKIILGEDPGLARNGASILRHCYIWNRPLSSSEVAWLYQDPYAMFTKPTKYISVASTLSTIGMRRSLGITGTKAGSRQLIRNW